MATRRLSLAQVREIDLGLVEAAFDHELAVVTRDLADRDKLKKVRSVILQMDFLPGSTDGRVAVMCKVTSKIPPRSTEVYQMTQVGEDGLIFNAASPDDPQQLTLDGVEEKGEDEV